MTGILRSEKGHTVICPKCGYEIMSAEATSVELEIVCIGANRLKFKLPCGCTVWVRDIKKFNYSLGYRSLESGCFTESLISPRERIRIFCYISGETEIEGMLRSLGYRMVFEEKPSSKEMDDENGSYPICSGEQIWVRGTFSTIYVNRQYCGKASFRGNTHVAVVGVIDNWQQVAELINLHREREKVHQKYRQERQGRRWDFLFTERWEEREYRQLGRRLAPFLDVKARDENISQGLRMIFK